MHLGSNSNSSNGSSNVVALLGQPSFFCSKLEEMDASKGANIELLGDDMLGKVFELLSPKERYVPHRIINSCPYSAVNLPPVSSAKTHSSSTGIYNRISGPSVECL